jgi:hypothetical protein
VLGVEVVLGLDRPRHVAQPLEVGRAPRCTPRPGRDALQAGELAVRLLAHLLRHAGLLDLLLQLLDLALRLVGLAQLLADRLHLLAQHEFLLVLVDRLAHRLLDVLADLQQLQLAPQDLREALESEARIQLFEQRLLVLGLEVEQRRDEVRDPARALLVARRRRGFVGDVGRDRHHLLELRDHRLLERSGLDVAQLLLFGERLDPGLEVGLFGQHFEDPHPRDALHQDRDPVVGDAHHAQHGGERSDPVEVAG